MAEYRKAQEVREATVLRIKRKRNEDPYNALIIHTSIAKKKKLNDEISSSQQDESNLFKFAGTITDKEIHQSTTSLVHDFRKSNCCHHTDMSQIKSNARKKNKKKQQLSRYKIISQFRQDVDNKGISQETDEEIERMLKIYDVVADDVDQTKDNNVNNTCEGDMLCNSVKMIREKLTLNDEKPTDSEYVYDLYFAPGAVILNNDEMILNIERYNEELIIDNQGDSNEEDNYDDEDDENDADNWRNDYPEEEDCYSSSENEDNGYDHSSDEDDHGYNRYRTGEGRLQFDPYADYDTEDYFHTVADDVYDDL